MVYYDLTPVVQRIYVILVHCAGAQMMIKLQFTKHAFVVPALLCTVYTNHWNVYKVNHDVIIAVIAP